MISKVITVSCVFFSFWAASGSSTAHAQQFPDPALQHPDINRLVGQVSRELDLLTYVMGKRENQAPPLPVSHVSEHEVFLQAQTLLRKANTLAQEIAGAPRMPPPALPDRELQPQEVHAIVESALEQILQVKARLKIQDEIEPPERNAGADATANFQAIVQANRQLNLIIERQLLPRDVFEQVSLAVIYAAGVLAAYPSAVPVPDAPLFEGGKKPVDVYNRLIECLRIIQRVADRAGGEVLRLNLRRGVQDTVPEDVFDLAGILVADVGYLAQLLDAGDVFPDLPTPEYVFPSHVFQRAGILRAQLLQPENLL